MSELAISLLRLGYLVALWFLVFAAIGVLRADVFGTRVVPRGAGRPARTGRGRRQGARPGAAPGARPVRRDRAAPVGELYD